MEQEFFLSGYCRRIDGARTVCAVTEDGVLTETDCDYGVCPYQPQCPIAKEIAGLQA